MAATVTRLALALAASILAASLAAEAQLAAYMPRIGYLQGSVAANPQLREGFLQGLRDLG